MVPGIPATTLGAPSAFSWSNELPSSQESSALPNMDANQGILLANNQVTVSQKNKELWQQFFQEPSHWWDNRFTKTNIRAPDFVHSKSQEKLWIDEPENPPWVAVELASIKGRGAWSLKGATTWELGINAFSDPVCRQEAVHRLVDEKRWDELLWIANCLQYNGDSFSHATFMVLLDGCINQRNLAAGREVHILIDGSNYKSSMWIKRKLIHMYALCGSLVEANQVFEDVHEPDVMTWTAIISAHGRFGQSEKAISLYHKSKEVGVKPDSYNVVAVLQACGIGQALGDGEIVHLDVVYGGFEQITFVGNSLINMYAKCGNFESACLVFQKLFNKDVVSWNAIISGYLDHHNHSKVLEIFKEMQMEGVQPNPVTFVCTLKASTLTNNVSEGRLIHAQVIYLGLESDNFVGSTLMDMYAKNGDLESTERVFYRVCNHNRVMWNILISGYALHGFCYEACHLLQKMQEEGIEPDNVTWNAIIKGHVQHGHSEAAIELFERLWMNGTELDNGTIVSILKGCSSHSDLEKGKMVHKLLITEHHKQDVIVGCSLIDMYIKCCNLESACKVFNEWSVRNVISWNAIIAGHAQLGRMEEALHLLHEMHCEGIAPDVATWNILIIGYARHYNGEESINLYKKMLQNGVNPDQNTISSVIKACSIVNAIEDGRIIHADITVRCAEEDIVVLNSLIDMYCTSGLLEDAYWLFSMAQERDVITWSRIISAYADMEYAYEVIELYQEMEVAGIKPNAYIFVSVLKAISCLRFLKDGRLFHAQVVEHEYESETAVTNSVINMYTACNALDDANTIFEDMANRDVITWTTMIAGLVNNGQHRKALSVYRQMGKSGCEPSSQTFVHVLRACSSLHLLNVGKWLHNRISQMGYFENVYVVNALIDMYANCNSINDAEKVFFSSPNKDLVTWNSMISGYLKHGNGDDVILLFHQMCSEGIKLDHITFMLVLKACCMVVALGVGKLVHSCIIGSGLETDEDLLIVLINMYARCGSKADAFIVSNRFSNVKTSAWSGLIAALAYFDDFEMAQSCFTVMQETVMKPNAVTLLSMLCAYSHAGKVDEGCRFFSSMEANFGIKPEIEHYNCLIDLLGRTEYLEEAEDLLELMPFRTNEITFISMLTHCRSFCKPTIGRRCFNYLSLINHHSTAGYVLMSQIYAQASMWQEAEEIEEIRIKKGLFKMSGKALIEVDNKLHAFSVGDKSHSQLLGVHKRLERLNLELKRVGNKPCRKPGETVFDIYEEDSTIHCEKLAIAFGLINTSRGSTLRIFTNLRVGLDCHDDVKAISRIERREIIIADSYRVHHFKDGVCSCRDYF